MAKSLVQRCIVLVSLLTAVGCAQTHHEGDLELAPPADDESGEDGDPGDDESDPDGDDSLPQDDDADDGVIGWTECGSEVPASFEVLEKYCAGCHSPDSPGEGGFLTVLDPTALVATGYVIPDDPENSPLYQRIASNQMPPAGKPRPSAEEIEHVYRWIACGAYKYPLPSEPSYSFTSIQDRLNAMLEHLAGLTTPEARLDVRYLDLTPLANSGYPRKTVEEYQQALTFLLNSLSRAAHVAPLEPVGRAELILAVRLSHFGWTSETWDSVVASYPYAVRYTDSPGFPYVQAEASEELRALTGTSIPFIQGDWFLSHAASAPLYYDVLGLPANLSDLASELGVDVEGNVASADAARAAFTSSATARVQRVVERHAIDAERGLWLTHDFASAAGSTDVFAEPLALDASSQHVRFELPNGLAAYMIVDASGERLDSAPVSAAVDPASRDGLVHAGLSCLNCHAVNGVLGFTDELRSTLSASTHPERDLLLGLYRPQSELDSLVTADWQRYQNARATEDMAKVTVRTLHTVDQRYRDELTVADAAAALGLDLGTLHGRLGVIADPDALFAVFREPGGVMERASFEALFPGMVEALGLGEPISGP